MGLKPMPTQKVETSKPRSGRRVRSAPEPTLDELHLYYTERDLLPEARRRELSFLSKQLPSAEASYVSLIESRREADKLLSKRLLELKKAT